MIVKIHNSYRLVVAICDSELLGKKFKENNKTLDLTGNFFKGDEKSIEEVKEIMEDTRREDATFNLIGKESCNLALSLRLVKQAGISYVENIPFALVLL